MGAFIVTMDIDARDVRAISEESCEFVEGGRGLDWKVEDCEDCCSDSEADDRLSCHYGH